MLFTVVVYVIFLFESSVCALKTFPRLLNSFTPSFVPPFSCSSLSLSLFLPPLPTFISLYLVASEDKSDSISSDDEIAFSSDEEDGLHTNAVDHYESLVSCTCNIICITQWV